MSATKIRMSTESYFDADTSINSKKLTSVADPTLEQDAATKNYVDGRFAALSVLEFKGVQDCSGNPNYPAGNAGDTYVVSVGGKIGGASGTSVSATDMYLCITTSAGGTQGSVGANWDVIHASGSTGSVNSSGANSATTQIAIFSGTSGTLLTYSLATIDSNGSINIPTGQTYKINGTALAPSNVGLGNVSNNAQLILAKYIVRETPTGTKNGGNAAFTLTYTPVTGTEMVFLNGMLQNAGGNDYSIATATITMTTAPVSTDVLLVTYVSQ